MKNNIRPGQLVYWREQAAIVHELKGFKDAILRTIDGARTEIASVSDLTITLNPRNSQSSQHLLAKDKDWDKALGRYEAIQPLLENSRRTTDDIQRVAD